jgi:Fic family protein
VASKAEIDDQLAALTAVIGTAQAGLGIREILGQSNLGLDRRTLQRRLETLVAAGDVVRSGNGSRMRYQRHSGTTITVMPPVIPLSEAGARVQAAISRPLQARGIVGYQRGFLDAYRPNVTTYLSRSEQAHLRTIGQPNVAAQPAGTYAKNVLNRLLIDLSWNSSRLEGNTYSLLDTKRLVDFGQEAEGKDRRDAQMILNHKAAIEFLVQSADEINFNRLTLLNLHALLADGLLEDPNSPGRLRTILIGIDGSTYHPPGVPQLVAECFDQILATATAVSDPFEQALFVMAQLPYLQPFDDVNKRVSRLAANIPLIRGNLCPLSFIDVPKEVYTQATLGVYELNDISLLRDVFIWAYERSASRYAAVRQQIGEPDPFRFRYRAALQEVVGAIIRDCMDRHTAFDHLKAWAASHVDVGDQAPFREMAEAELMALHEGNFARFQIRPTEFMAWYNRWHQRLLDAG